jgi:protein SCO1/2
MATVTRRVWLTTFGLAPVMGSLVARAATGGSGGARQALSGRARIQRHHLPNVELVTHTRQRVRFYDDLVRDKKVIINFMYATCDAICPRVTANLVRVRQLLGGRVGREIFMYSITLKPKEDSPEALRDYAKRHGVRGDGWLFLTGTPGDIDHLRRALGFAYADPVEDADVSNHAGMLRFGVEALTRWAACPGMANPEHIARTILWDLG